MLIRKVAKPNWVEVRRHIKIWLLLGIFFYLTDIVQGSVQKKIFVNSSILLNYIFIYYSELFFVYPLLLSKKKWVFLLYFICIYLSAVAIYYFICLYFRPEFISFNYKEISAWLTWLSSFFIYFSITSTIAYGSFQSKCSKLKMQLAYEKEKFLLQQELSFYKNQFNPEDINDFLNYCYSYIKNEMKETAEALSLFSKMFQYSSANIHDIKVLLEEEITYINLYLKLQKCLHPNSQVIFTTEGDFYNKYIYPHILINFVENSFKHGISNLTESPITIKLMCTENKLIFEVSNKKLKDKNKISTGIGQNNANNQLELFYERRYKINIKEDEEDYNCRLEIFLTE